MNTKSRLLYARMIEQMQKNEDYSRRLGLSDQSTFRGKPMKNTPGNVEKLGQQKARQKDETEKKEEAPINGNH